jgi:hypothetical protein
LLDETYQILEYRQQSVNKIQEIALPVHIHHSFCVAGLAVSLWDPACGRRERLKESVALIVLKHQDNKIYL